MFRALSLFLLIPCLTHAAECPNSGVIDQIKAYVNCQGTTKLLACGALGGLATAGVARGGARLAKNQINKSMARDAAGLFDDLIEDYGGWGSGRPLVNPTDELDKLRQRLESLPANTPEAERKRLSAEVRALDEAIKKAEIKGTRGYHLGPVYKPVLVTKSDQTFDVANLKLKQQPNRFQESARARVQVMSKMIRELELPHASLDKEYTDRVMAALAKMDPDANVDQNRRLYQAAIRISHNNQVRVLSSGFGPALVNARKLGRFAPALGGVVGLVVAAVGYAAASDAGACDHAYSPYINEDSSGGCRPKYEVDNKVADFIMRPDEEREKILDRHPEVCRFYAEMKKRFFAEPRYKGLVCRDAGTERGSVIIKASVDGKPREYHVDTRADGTVAAVGIRGAGGMKVRLFNFVNEDNELTTKIGASSTDTWAEYRQIKMFLPEAISCCAGGDQSCTKHFGGEAESVPTRGGSTPTAI